MKALPLTFLLFLFFHHAGTLRIYVAKNKRPNCRHRTMCWLLMKIPIQQRVNYYPVMSIIVLISMNKLARARAHVWVAPVVPITNCSSIRDIIRLIYSMIVYVQNDRQFKVAIHWFNKSLIGNKLPAIRVQKERLNAELRITILLYYREKDEIVFNVYLYINSEVSIWNELRGNGRGKCIKNVNCGFF